MQTDGFEDGFWDEHQWEAHLEEVEKKSEQLRRFIASDQKGNTPRWITLLKESLSEDDAVDAFIEEELLLDEAYFPEEDDDWEDEDDYDDEDFLFGSNDMFEDEDEEDFDAGEEWKALSEDYTLSDYGSIDNLHLYTLSRMFAVDLIKWAEKIPASARPPMLEEFVSHSLKIGAKLAGGYSFGFELDYLGANIAYTKRALHFANEALKQLHELKGYKYFTHEGYADFHRRLFEIRNDIGIYIQELRERFKYGLE